MSKPVDPELLSILICPVTAKPLREATPAEVEAVNAMVRAGEAKTHAGEGVAEVVDAGLLSDEPGSLFYPIRDGIPILLKQEAIVRTGSRGTQ